MKRSIAAGVVVAILFVVGQAVWAGIPDSNGILYACYSTTGNPNTRNVMRIIDLEVGEVCPPGDSVVSWRERERPLYTKVQSFTFPVGPHQETLSCNQGDIATGGGFRLSSTVTGIRLEANNPTLDLSGWQLTIQNDAGANTSAEVFVVCKDWSF